MNAVDMIRRLHEHRAWVNEKLLRSAESLSDESLRQPLAIGQGSIWKSLVHLYAAEYVWLETLLGSENPILPGDVPGKLPGNQAGEHPIPDLAELKTRWQQLDLRWRAYLDCLTSDELDERLFKVSSSSGKRQASRRGDILLHVCLHAHYTTAQVINMLRQVGAEALPDPMLISLAREQLANA